MNLLLATVLTLAAKNVLFIAVDDLRPEIGAYGVKLARTPNIDRLAAEGVLFERAYVSQAVCSPSRTSLLLGRRPDTHKVYDLQTHFRLNMPDVVTLPQHFKQNGYYTQGFGKIFHGGLDDPASWSATLPARDKTQPEDTSSVLQKDPKTGLVLKRSPPPPRDRGPSWDAPDVADDKLQDGLVAVRAIEKLKEMKGKPFFLAVGFLKPHLPFIAPKKYFDQWKGVTIPTARNPQAPKDVPPMALTSWGELRNYRDIPKTGPLPEGKAAELVRAYYAATSYTDAQIGKLLAALDQQGLRDSTTVVLWGDHGWNLGEHGMWCKHANFEVTTRTTLVMRAPGHGKPGTKQRALVETVDLYPTLAELAGLPAAVGVEGTSLVPLLDDPKRPWKTAAFSQYPRAGDIMGYAMRTDRYRYVEWLDAQKKAVGVELYDHQTDPDENVNVAGSKNNATIVADLSKKLLAGWRAATPPATSKKP